MHRFIVERVTGVDMKRIVLVLTASAFVTGGAIYAYRKIRERKQKQGADHSEKVHSSLATADSQQRELLGEQCIVVDESDKVIRSGSKKECHIMQNIDRGLLHRAFSVFLFNKEGKLLLQKRSRVKITFPSYWANTCCSHPLYNETEMEERDALGVKRAAQRKLQHELGIPKDELPLECFKFLTRVHYKAADEHPWGEHEIDYVLIARPPKDVTLSNLNENEVEQVKYFDRHELRQWMNSTGENRELVSPWFQIIEGSLLQNWWDALEKDLKNCKSIDDPSSELNKWIEPDMIHRAGAFK